MVHGIAGQSTLEKGQSSRLLDSIGDFLLSSENVTNQEINLIDFPYQPSDFFKSPNARENIDGLAWAFLGCLRRKYFTLGVSLIESEQRVSRHS